MDSRGGATDGITPEGLGRALKISGQSSPALLSSAVLTDTTLRPGGKHIMENIMDSNGNIPREYRYWPCPDPKTCEARNVSGHNPYYCPFGPEKDKRGRPA